MSIEDLARISAPYFCAGLVLENDVVVRAAPILGYMRGWSLERVSHYAKSKRWTLQVLRAEPNEL